MTQDRAEAPPPQPARLPGERESFALINGLHLRVREWGDAGLPAVVLLHGLRGFSGTWRYLARRLAGQYRLIALDQRGRGDSEWDPGHNYYTDAYLADLEALVDQLKLDRFTLLGHSMGGTTSYVYASRHPDRLRALIIEDIAPGSSIQGAGAERIVNEMAKLPVGFASWTEARAYWRAARPSLSDAAIDERVAESLTATPTGTITWRYDAEGIRQTRMHPDPARIVDLWPVVDSLRIPTLIIRGGRSDFCPLATVETMASRNPHIRQVTVPDAGHYVHDDAPETFGTLVHGFLDETLQTATQAGGSHGD